ncbi:hypothetical protein ACLOJK_006395 [Asimina triloba]
MEGYEKCLREKRSHHHACRNPSFSSTLLDAIYRSIDHEQGLDHHNHHHQTFADHDEEEEQQQQQLFFYQQTTRKKQISSRDHHQYHHGCMHSCRVDQWLEKKSAAAAAEKPTTLRWSDFDDGFRKPTTFFNSTSSSSDSSCGGGFSSSETESIHGLRRHSSSSSAYSHHHPNPIPTTMHNKTQQIPPNIYIPPPSAAAAEHKKKTSKQDGFIKTKSRTASKIYNELKKARQPISPGGRLASFLNSIFAAGQAKKAKILSSSSSIDGPHDLGYDRKSKSAQASTCSSASSFSRSCLSKTPSSRGGKPINGGAKRSVRFLIVDEDGRPCGGGDDNLKIRLVEKSKRVEEAAKEMLKEYQLKKRERMEEVIRAVHHSHEHVDDDEEDDDDDDAGSCSSSDLFELENLTAIGMERYREELPVYETTHLGTNRAIANGLIL